MGEFVHLHVHSEYSLLDGSGHIEKLAEAAARQGMKALALTDHGVMYGTIPFYKACRAKGIKPIIGVEVYVTNDPLDKKMKKGEQKLYHLVLLAETNQGYQNLIKLTSKAHLEGFYYKPRVTKAWLKEHSEGIICLSGCLTGELQQAVLHDQLASAKQIAQEHEHIFGKGNYFIELQDHGLAEQKKINARLVRLAEELGIPLVVTNDVHYIHAHEAVAHDCLLCIGTGKKVEDEQRLKFPGAQFYMKTPREMYALFPHLQQAYENTVRIADRCEVEIPLGGEILPRYPLPEGKSNVQFLREKCEQGLQERYARVTPEIRERLEYELQIITQMGYTDYFLIVWDFMHFAHQRGIITGPGRGSAAGSLVAYVLKITNVDPIRYNLLFERFLNPERITMPDIDIDFSDRRRDEVIQYVVQKYGQDRVAQIITFGTLGAKACVRDVGRVLGLPLKVVDQVAKCIPSGPGMTLAKAMQTSPELQKWAAESEEIERLLEIAGQLEGLARHTSTHAAGVVISGEPLTNVVPLQEGHDGVPLTQYAMEDLEALGLLKMDFLGLRNLSLLEEILRIVNQNRPADDALTLENIPLDDPDTFRLLSSGDTSGVFQLESEGMKSVLKRLKPTHFEDIIAVLALYRPGPMENIPLFIDAKHGRTEVTYPHEDLQPILKDTYGIIVYQEQIMQIASKMAGFSLGEADLLRRAVGKKKRDILEEERTHFVQGCLQQGYTSDVAEHVYDLIVRFADYGFNRSHSAAYAVIAYQLAYLKTHFPVAFLASLMSMNIGSEEKVAEYLHQAARRGIRVLPPSVVSSDAGFTVEDGQIRLGLSVIKHVGTSAIAEIKRARRQGPFRNLLDFCQRVNVRICNRRVIESLIMAGALDDLDMHRAQALANLDTILEMSEQAQGLRESDQLYFFADELPDDYAWTDVPRYTELEKLKAEKEVLGFYLSGHPLDPYRRQARTYGVTFISELVRMNPPGQPLRTIGMVLEVRRITTKKGEMMAFLRLEDQGVELDVVVFPAVMKKYVHLFQEEQLLLFEGRMEERDDHLQLVASKAADLSRISLKRGARKFPSRNEKAAKPLEKGINAGPKLFIKITPRFESSPKMKQLQKYLKENRGNTPVFLYYERRKETISLGDSYKIKMTEDFLRRVEKLLGDPDAVKVNR